MENRNASAENVIAGRNAVAEAIKSGRVLDTLFVSKGSVKGTIAFLVAQAKERGVVIKEADPKKLDALCGHANHQGVVAVGAVKEYAELSDIFSLAQQRGEAPFLILADELNDPHNLGAILRIAECAGVHGIVIPKRNSVGLTYAVGKASAGAVEYVPVVRTSNMVSTMEELKKRGVWIYAADMGGQDFYETDYSGPVALVIGSEGSGVGRLVKEKSDFVISLPMCGKINSLNASVACGILCYEIARRRGSFQVK